jgi:hypothetical protein
MYCAEISRIKRQRIEVNYYTTTVTPALANYDVAGRQRRITRIKEATFLNLGTQEQRRTPSNTFALI